MEHLLQQIEELRNELNKIIAQESKEINNEELLKLSQRLDELILKC